MITPQVCQDDHALRGAGEAGCGMAIEAMKKNGPRSGAHSHPRRCYPATCLMRAIISSTAFSGVHLSTTTRFTAFAHTFSLLRMVNL